MPRCLFQLHRDQLGVTWHAINSIPIDLITDLSAINSSSRGTVKHLLAVEDLGRGSSGKVWSTCTVSKKSSICVLKFHNHDSTSAKLCQEKKKWDLIYPELQSITSVRVVCAENAGFLQHSCVSKGCFPTADRRNDAHKVFKTRTRSLRCEVENHRLLHGEEESRYGPGSGII